MCRWTLLNLYICSTKPPIRLTRTRAKNSSKRPSILIWVICCLVFIQVLEESSRLLTAEREYVAAITHTHRLLQVNPLYEACYVQLTDLYTRQNDRARALRAYHTCTTVLERELGVPSDNDIKQGAHLAPSGSMTRWPSRYKSHG